MAVLFQLSVTAVCLNAHQPTKLQHIYLALWAITHYTTQWYYNWTKKSAKAVSFAINSIKTDPRHHHIVMHFFVGCYKLCTHIDSTMSTF